MKCNYCGRAAILISGESLYGVKSSEFIKRQLFYRCDHCDAHVGIHKGTSIPFVTLANKELRLRRTCVHNFMDSLWKSKEPLETREAARKQKERRTKMYRWLAYRLGIDFSDCHIGMFDIVTCDKVLLLLNGVTWQQIAEELKELK